MWVLLHLLVMTLNVLIFFCKWNTFLTPKYFVIVMAIELDSGPFAESSYLFSQLFWVSNNIICKQ